MRIKLKNEEKQVELIKAMASKDGVKRAQAQESFAGFIGPVIQQVLNLMGQARTILTDWPFNEDDSPEFPLDMFYATNVDQVTVWTQNMAGGLPSSLVTGLQTLKLHTYRLDSAVSFLETNIRRGRLPVVSLGLNRLVQELLKKQELNRWAVILKAVGEAQTGANKHVITANTANVLQVDDFNNLVTRSQILNTAFDGGTPESVYTKGATDMFLSPEAMEEIRSWAYQPMNTRAVPNTDESTAVPLPDSIREQIYNASGIPEIFGINLHAGMEFGISRLYNTLFAKFITGTINGPGGSAFATATDELVLAVDNTREACLRPVAQNADSGSEVTTETDDQFSRRSGKIGFFSHTEEGCCIIDSRILTGIVF